MRILWLITLLLVGATSFVYPSLVVAAPLAQSDPIQPLPRGCGSVTAPGAALAACCLSGMVIADGRPVAGAEVTITNPHGNRVVLTTQIYTGTDSRPIYQLSLSTPPLVMQMGETITVTARYSGHEHSLSYIVQPDSQQVDVVLARSSADDAVVDAEVWSAAPVAGAGDGQLQQPSGVAVAADGSFAVVDRGNHRIQQFASDGHWLRSWGGFGSAPGQLNDPVDLAQRNDGTFYVANRMGGRIDHFDPTGQWLEAFTATPLNGGQFFRPTSVAVDASGMIYSVDAEAGTLFSINPAGTTVWAHFDPGQPQGIAVATDGQIYVGLVDGVRVYPPDGGTTRATWTGLGRVSDVALDAQGSVLVSESGAMRVSKFRPDGMLLSQWGQPLGEPTSYPMVGTLASPMGIAVGPDGRSYVGDSGNNRVTIFRPMTYTRPVATITYQNAATLPHDERLTLMGMGQASDPALPVRAFRWRSDRDGIIATEPTLIAVASSLTPGNHRITLEVQSSSGEWSDPLETTVLVSAPPQATWTVLLYLDGDLGDQGQTWGAFSNALTRLTSQLTNPAVRVAAQLDGPADGDTTRLLFTPNVPPTLTRLNDLPEQAMDSPTALAEFLRWGQGAYPAQYYYLVIAGQGQAIQGLAWDQTSDQRDDGVANASAYLTNAELAQALHAEGVAPINVLHLDASALSMLEVAYELRPLSDGPPQTQLLIASQYRNWNYYPYAAYANSISIDDTPAQVARKITAIYAAQAQADHVPYTLVALDLGRATRLAAAVDALAGELTAQLTNDRVRRDELAVIWQVSPRFESNGDYLNNLLDAYVDLRSWAQQVQAHVANPAVKQRAAALISELVGPYPFIVPGTTQVGHGTLPHWYANGPFIDLTGASGVSIFYPDRQDTVAFDTYVNQRSFTFTRATRWASFLVAEGTALNPGPLQPLPGPLSTLNRGVRVFLPMLQR